MAKTIEEIIDVMGFTLNDDRDSQKAVISEIYYGFNQPESKIVFSGLIKDIPEELKNTRYTQACFDPKQIPTKLNIQIMHLLKVKNYFNSYKHKNLNSSRPIAIFATDTYLKYSLEVKNIAPYSPITPDTNKSLEKSGILGYFLSIWRLKYRLYLLLSKLIQSTLPT